MNSSAFLRRKPIFQRGVPSSSPESIWISSSSTVCQASTQIGKPGSLAPGLYFRNVWTQSSQASIHRVSSGVRPYPSTSSERTLSMLQPTAPSP